MKQELRVRDSIGWPLLSVLLLAALLVATDLLLEHLAPRRIAHHGEQQELLARIMTRSPVSSEALAIAERFETDTLPTLFMEGVVRQFSQKQEMTILKVDEKLWAKKGSDLRMEILMEMMISTRVKGYLPVAEVRDFTSEKLLVDIHLPDEVVYYD